MAAKTDKLLWELVDKFESSADFSELSYESNDFKLSLKRGAINDSTHFNNYVGGAVAAPAVNASNQPVIEAPAGANETAVTKNTIKSKFMGVYYSKPAPDKPEYVKVGSQINEGDVIGIVETMKVMNNIVAPKSGTVVEILVSNEDIVEFDQDLFVIE